MDRSVEDAWYRDWQGPPDEEFAGDASDDEDEGQHEATSSPGTARVLAMHGQKRFRHVGEDEQRSLRLKKYAADQLGVRWQDRGPTGSEDLEQPAHVEAGHDEESITDAITVATYEERRKWYYNCCKDCHPEAFLPEYEGARRILQVAVD